MAQCANHPDRAAQQNCSRCGKGLCEQCVELWDQEKPFCYDCAVELQLSEMRERSREEKAAMEEAKEARRKVGSRSFIITTAVVAMLLLASVGFLLFSHFSLRSGRVEATPEQEQTWSRDQCLLSMQGVREALASYQQEKGYYPHSLAELQGAYLEQDAVCPESGAPYLYQAEGKGYRLSCPNPGEHGADSVEADESTVPHAVGEGG